MTKEITVSEIVPLKSGTNAKGAWTLWVIKDEDGQEYTTFNNVYSVGKTTKISYKEEVDGSFIRRRIVEPTKRFQKRSNFDAYQEQLNRIEEKLDKIINGWSDDNQSDKQYS